MKIATDEMTPFFGRFTTADTTATREVARTRAVEERGDLVVSTVEALPPAPRTWCSNSTCITPSSAADVHPELSLAPPDEADDARRLDGLAPRATTSTDVDTTHRESLAATQAGDDVTSSTETAYFDVLNRLTETANKWIADHADDEDAA